MDAKRAKKAFGLPYGAVALSGILAGCQSETKPAASAPTPVEVTTVEQFVGNEGANYSASLVRTISDASLQVGRVCNQYFAA